MRTPEEIVARIKQIKEDDFFGFTTGDLLSYLPFEYAKPFLIADAKAEQWTTRPADTESVLAEIREYMEFAWDKANNCRGLSANRSINHMEAWLWMLGEDRAVEDLAEDYDRYGKPQLAAICEHFGWDWRKWDDGNWVNQESGPNLGVRIAKLRWDAPSWGAMG